MPARMFVWPKYVLEVNGKRATFPKLAGSCIARMFLTPAHFVSTEDLIEAAYFDREDGGPLGAGETIRVSIYHARKALADLRTTVQGRQKAGGLRLLFPWHHNLREFSVRALGIKNTGNRGPYRYLSSHDGPAAESVSDFIAYHTETTVGVTIAQWRKRQAVG